MCDCGAKKDSSQLKLKTYLIEGDPVALARPRLTTRGIWDSQRKLKTEWILQLQQQHHNLPELHGPLHLDLTFFMPIPESRSLKKRTELVGTYHLFKPDTSNMIKFVEDCAQGVIFKDDCQISIITCKKVYDDNSRTEFTITELL
jgi:Holliday junction resolvase RusA-like endonuclease